MKGHPIIKEWEARVAELSASFKDTFGHLSQDQLELKPDTGVWSIADNLRHLIRINESYYPLFEQLKNNELRISKIGKWMHKLMGKMILNSVQPDRKKKIKTFNIWEPKSFDREGSTLDAFLSHQESFLLELESLNSFIDENPVLHSPANTSICYSLTQAIDIILTHEERHLNQAKELL